MSKSSLSENTKIAIDILRNKRDISYESFDLNMSYPTERAENVYRELIKPMRAMAPAGIPNRRFLISASERLARTFVRDIYCVFPPKDEYEARVKSLYMKLIQEAPKLTLAITERSVGHKLAAIVRKSCSLGSTTESNDIVAALVFAYDAVPEIYSSLCYAIKVSLGKREDKLLDTYNRFVRNPLDVLIPVQSEFEGILPDSSKWNQIRNSESHLNTTYGEVITFRDDGKTDLCMTKDDLLEMGFKVRETTVLILDTVSTYFLPWGIASLMCSTKDEEQLAQISTKFAIDIQNATETRKV